MMGSRREILGAVLVLGLAAHAMADGKAHLDAALAAVEKRDIATAAAEAAKVAEGDHYRADARFCLAWCHAEAGEHDKAVQVYGEVVKLRPADARAWNNLGVALDEVGRLQEATDAYTRAIEADPRYASAWNNKGVALDKMGEGDRAAKLFEQAIDLDPTYAAPHNNLGAWHYERGDKRAASKAWSRAAKIDPDYVSPIVNRAVLEFDGDRKATAEQRLRNLVSSGKVSAEVWFNLGVFAYRRGEFDEALRAMTEADRLRGNDPETLNNLGVLHFMKGNHRRAEVVFKSAIEHKPGMVKAWDNLGLLLYRSGRFAEARTAFEKEVALDPAAAYGHYNLGCAQAAEKNYADARQSFERAVELAPDHVDALHNLAILSGGQTETDASATLAAFKRVVKADPDYAPGHLSLGRFYHSDPQYRDLKKALHHYRKFVALEHKDLAMVEQVTKTIAGIRGRR